MQLPSCTAFANAPISTYSARTFQIAGDASFIVQGGSSNGCGVPKSATAVSLSLLGVSSTADAIFTVYPFGVSRPDRTDLSAPTANAPAVAAVLAPLGSGLVTVYSKFASNVSGTVGGYHVPQIHADIAADGAVSNGTSRVLGAKRTATGQYAVAIDRTLGGCSVYVSPVAVSGGATATATTDGSVVEVSTQSLQASPAPADVGFTLIVSC